MKLTIVSASYNVISASGKERMIESIRSVAALKIEHEHLIFDGASTDGTLEVLKSLEEEITSLKVVSEKDSGIYEALNKGVRAAEGEYLYVIGLDDAILKPDLLSAMVEKASAGAFDMYISPVKVMPKAVLDPNKRSDFYNEGEYIAYGHQGVIVRMKYLREICPDGFDESYRITADFKQLLSLHYSGAKVGLVNEPFAEFRTGGTSVNREKVILETERALREVYHLSEAEFDHYRSVRRLPLRVVIHYLLSGSVFSAKIAFKLLKRSFIRKIKSERMSTYYFWDIPLYSHLSKHPIGDMK